MNQKIIFLSHPMSDLDDKEVKKVTHEMIKYAFREFGHNIVFIDTFAQELAPSDCVTENLWYLGNSIKALAKADVILFSRDWSTSKGCRVEHQIAEIYGIETKYMD